MILFGTKGRAIEMDKGKFNCPNCNENRDYSKKYVQTWFTLYFIPIFPVGEKKNEHIECQKCQNIYHIEVANYQPNLDAKKIESEYEKALKNVLCLMIIADGKIKSKEVDVVSNIFNKLTNNKKFSKAQIDKIIDKLKKSKKNS